jgi:hypothetical protein
MNIYFQFDNYLLDDDFNYLGTDTPNERCLILEPSYIWLGLNDIQRKTI